MHYRKIFVDPIVDNNPVTLQMLGVCSALAVTRTLLPALIMAITVTCVLIVSNTAVSALRHMMPRSVRLILEMTLIASAVIIADETLKAFAPATSETLSVFVGLIITNCIVLGRAEAFALNNSVGASFLDGLGHGLGYGAVLILVGSVRELLGEGSLLGYPVMTMAGGNTWFTNNQFMHLAPSAFFLIAVLIWAVRSVRTAQIEPRSNASGAAIRS